jgi:hypothetical protein
MNVPALPNLLTTAAVGSIRDVLAATATPQAVPAAPALTDVRLPRLTLTVTARRVRGVPLSLKAGRYLLTVIGDPPSPTSPGGVMLIQLPAGMTLDEAMAEAERATDAPPFFLHSIMPGGAEIGEDGLSRTVVDLTPGEWIVAGYAMSTLPTTMTVTGALPASLPEPPANAAVTVDARGIGVDGSLRPGRNVIRIENASREPRFVELERLTGRRGHAEVITASADQSAGTSMWMQVVLDPGFYRVRDGLTGVATGHLAVA